MKYNKVSMRPFRKQRSFIFVLVVSISLLLVLGNAYAWFAQTDNVKNVLKSPDLGFSFEIDEVFVPPTTVTPGQTVQKEVNVKNTGDESGFVRVLVLAEIISAEGKVLEAIPGTTFTFDGLNVTDWAPGYTKIWADGGDGYYYYLAKLAPGMSTAQPLFSSVTLADDLSPEYAGATMKIEVKVEASETNRAKYRDGWWGNGDTPPGTQDLKRIDTVLEELL